MIEHSQCQGKKIVVIFVCTILILYNVFGTFSNDPIIPNLGTNMKFYSQTVDKTNDGTSCVGLFGVDSTDSELSVLRLDSGMFLEALKSKITQRKHCINLVEQISKTYKKPSRKRSAKVIRSIKIGTNICPSIVPPVGLANESNISLSSHNYTAGAGPTRWFGESLLLSYSAMCNNTRGNNAGGLNVKSQYKRDNQEGKQTASLPRFMDYSLLNGNSGDTDTLTVKQKNLFDYFGILSAVQENMHNHKWYNITYSPPPVKSLPTPSLFPFGRRIFVDIGANSYESSLVTFQRMYGAQFTYHALELNARRHLESYRNAPANVHFHGYGLGAESGQMVFYTINPSVARKIRNSLTRTDSNVKGEALSKLNDIKFWLDRKMKTADPDDNVGQLSSSHILGSFFHEGTENPKVFFTESVSRIKKTLEPFGITVQAYEEDNVIPTAIKEVQGGNDTVITLSQKDVIFSFFSIQSTCEFFMSKLRITPFDYLVVKVDIEGGEWDLFKSIESHCPLLFPLIDEIYFECHSQEMGGQFNKITYSHCYDQLMEVFRKRYSIITHIWV
eukprot:Tbor_TRINITY_DN5067_c3_g1::TRINITY_DN5067_c3_g1_i1::g.14232::m.14232